MNNPQKPIRASDRLCDVFARDERLVDVIASHSSQLAKLRNSPMRRIMARVTTVEQAARLCGIPAPALLRSLNAVLGVESAPDESAASDGAGESPDATTTAPESNPPSPDSPTIDLDVRDDLRNGREPFSRIMAAVAALGVSEVLRVRATFQPVPLLGVMEKRGFAYRVEQHGPEDWSIWFHRSRTPPDGPRPAAGTHRARETDENRVRTVQIAPQVGSESVRSVSVLDVRGLEPPEPMVRTLEALEVMPEGHVLLQINSRAPQFLFPILRDRGFDYEIDESHTDPVRVRIWRRASPVDVS